MGFFNDLNGKLQSFIIGRNGSDRLGRWSIGAAIVVLVINMVVPNAILMALSYALLFYSIYRMFSRNVSARSAENMRFEELLDKLPFRKGKNGNGQSTSTGQSANKTQAGWSQSSAKSTDRSKIRIVCDQCGQPLSIPKGKGTLKVTCPKCNHQMKVKS